jgi:galactokinase
LPSHVIAFGPGRVNLIGEHTDYNQGLALPFAIADGVTVEARARGSRRIDVTALDVGEHDAFELDLLEPAEGWRAFVRGAAGELLSAGVKLAGASLSISGTVTRGAGLSSSAALEVALVLALLAVADAPEPDRIELAKLCSRIENDWVGAQTGLLDQIASLCGEPERALQIDFRTLEVWPVGFALGDFKLVTLDSGEEHTHAGSGYNQRREECAEAAERLGVESLRDATIEMAEQLASPLSLRVRHVVSENDRVRAAARALERCDMEELGRLLDASHTSLRDCYEVSTPAVEKAVARCKRAGALGARIMGGGFGGNVLALLPADASAPEGAVEVRPGPGARVS